MENIASYISFIQEAEKLKSILRTAWSSSGRGESTAEHSWRLALLAGVVLTEYPGLDGRKVLMMCLIHDMGEMCIRDSYLADSIQKRVPILQYLWKEGLF